MSREPGPGTKPPASERWYWLLWVAVAVAAGLFLLRFGMRAVGVLPDLPVPGMIYTVSSPAVERLYEVLPPPSYRFDQAAIEVASLAAAGAVVALGLAAYVLALLASWALRRPAS
jgi:hypothetical protein